MSEVPPNPEPVAVEIELTNICNARCNICPRDSLGRPGYLDLELYRRILDEYAAARRSFHANRLAGGEAFPALIFAGGGEPTLHRQAAELVRLATARGFPTEMYSNGTRLDAAAADALIAAGLGRPNLSFWGTTAAEYESSMKLDFDDTLRRLDQALPRFEHSSCEVSVTWQKAPGVVSDEATVARFWAARFPWIEVDMESNPENRAGNFEASLVRSHLSFYPPVDFAKPIYCSFSYFTDFICWNGDVLMCSPDFFGRKMVIGNIGVDSYAILNARKAEALREHRFRSICSGCRRYRNEATEFWDGVLPEREILKYRYLDQAPRS